MNQLEEEEAGTDPQVATRALLRVLGYDPDVHSIWVVQHPIPGIRVIDELNEPVKFFAEKALKKLGASEAFIEEYSMCVAEEELKMQELPDLSPLVLL